MQYCKCQALPGCRARENMHLARPSGCTTVGTRLAGMQYGRHQVLPVCRVHIHMHIPGRVKRTTVGTRRCVQYSKCCLAAGYQKLHLIRLQGRTMVGTRLACVEYGRCQVLPGCRAPKHASGLDFRAYYGRYQACMRAVQ